MPRTQIIYTCAGCGCPFQRRFSSRREARYCTNRCFHDARSVQRREAGAVLARFMAKITVDAASGCWLWDRHTDPSGYGRFTTRDKALSALAHRAAYEMLIGPVPDGMQLDHLCRTPRCANPHHLEVVTPRENWARGNSPTAIAARSDRCRNGHPYPPDQEVGRRKCKECIRASARRYRQANPRRKAVA